MGDFGEIKTTSDDEKARRLVTLSMMLTNSKTPLTSSSIREELYGDLTVDTFNKTFSRDRKDLAAMGVKIVKLHGDDEASWAIDETSLKGGAELDPDEAAVLNLTCQPLVNDPGFPYSNELRLALAKIDRQFSDASLAVQGRVAAATRVSETLRDCLETGRPARVTYTNAAGVKSTRVLAPYGFFTKRGSAYMVAAIMCDGEKGEGLGKIGEPRTFMLNRISEAKKLAKLTYQVPGDFDIASFRRLSFQIGPTVGEARFFVPARQEHEMRMNADEKGSWEAVAGGFEWRVDMSDARAAASCAIAWAIRPLAPKELVDAWKELLEGVIGNA